MFKTTTDKMKLPSDHAPTLRCLLQGPFRDIPFAAGDHRITPVHDVVFLDEIDNANVTPLIYRPMSMSPVPEPTGRTSNSESRFRTRSFCRAFVTRCRSSRSRPMSVDEVTIASSNTAGITDTHTSNNNNNINSGNSSHNRSNNNSCNTNGRNTSRSNTSSCKTNSNYNNISSDSKNTDNTSNNNKSNHYISIIATNGDQDDDDDNDKEQSSSRGEQLEVVN